METIRVLLVEDEDSDADYVVRMLKRAEDVRFTIDRVLTLKSALQAVELRAPDIVLLDLSLPDSHGYDTAVEFAKCADVPFIVLTGNDDVKMAMRCVSLGSQDYIIKNEVQAKPLERSILVAVKRASNERVHRHLEHQSRTLVLGDENRATTTMLRPYVSALIEAVEDLRHFITANAPGISADVQSLLDKYDTDVTIQVLRDTMRETAPSRERAISDAAIRAVDSVMQRRKAVAPVDATEADAVLVDILSRRERP